MTESMQVSVFGLGYVGTVSAVCLAYSGHQVTGVDVNPVKVDQIHRGESPLVEPGLNKLIQEVVASGHLVVTTDSDAAVKDSQVSLICVGTPSNDNGSLDIRSVKKVSGEIGRVLATKDHYHVVAVRSTVVPGTVEETVIPLLEETSGKTAGRDFGVCVNPEFLREGSAVEDFFHPSHIVIGAIDQCSGDTLASMYSHLDAPVVRTPIATAEMVKYANNSFHALKITFADQIGNLCKAHGIDGREIMDILCRDRQLNISATYLHPGFAFGGSCLPKDLRALLYQAKERDVDSPLLGAILPSNQQQIERGIRMIEATGKKRVAVLGLSFKAGTDDVRESPVVPLIERLVGRGYEVHIYDDKMELSRLIGANKTFLERELPHIATLLSASAEAAVVTADVVVVTKDSPAFYAALASLHADQTVIDLIGVDETVRLPDGIYEGICW